MFYEFCLLSVLFIDKCENGYGNQCYLFGFNKINWHDAKVSNSVTNKKSIYCRWRSSYQERRPGIPLTSLTPTYCCACPKAGPGFPTSYAVVFFFVSELRSEVVVRFVDIGGIVDHHYHYFNCLSMYRHCNKNGGLI